MFTTTAALRGLLHCIAYVARLRKKKTFTTGYQSEGLLCRGEGLDLGGEPELPLEEVEEGEVCAGPLAGGLVLEGVGEAARQGHPHRLATDGQARFLAHGGLQARGVGVQS